MENPKQCNAIYLMQDTVQKLMFELEIMKVEFQKDPDFDLNRHLQRAESTVMKMKNEMVDLLDYYPKPS